MDEVGTDVLMHLDKDRHQFLSLTGIAVPLRHAGDFLAPRMNEIKASIFSHDPDNPIVFHRKDILGGKGPFGILRKDAAARTEFDKRILLLMSETDFTAITALIDKKWMLKQTHWLNKHPYHYLMEILIEKYVQYLERQNSIGDIMPESRQTQKNRLLQHVFTDIKTNGTRFIKDSARIHSVIRTNNLKFRTKKDKISGLELCDLLAHPSHINVRKRMGHNVNLGPFSTKVAELLEREKYDRSPYDGKIIGYGIKHLPH
ncbi:MAG: hypothetical protein ACTSV1_07950 [Alphaproteobacteria bacterium]